MILPAKGFFLPPVLIVFSDALQQVVGDAGVKYRSQFIGENVHVESFWLHRRKKDTAFAMDSSYNTTHRSLLRRDDKSETSPFQLFCVLEWLKLQSICLVMLTKEASELCVVRKDGY